MRVQLVYFAGCPHVDAVRAVLARLGVAAEEIVADYPSPTVLVDGVDVMGDPPGRVAACRLDVPTEARLREALGRGG
jgi:hypothetical protein